MYSHYVLSGFSKLFLANSVSLDVCYASSLSLNNAFLKVAIQVIKKIYLVKIFTLKRKHYLCTNHNPFNPFSIKLNLELCVLLLIESVDEILQCDNSY